MVKGSAKRRVDPENWLFHGSSRPRKKIGHPGVVNISPASVSAQLLAVTSSSRIRTVIGQSVAARLLDFILITLRNSSMDSSSEELLLINSLHTFVRAFATVPAHHIAPILNLNANGNGTNGNGWWQREWAHTCHTKRSTLSVCCLRVAVSFLQSLNWSLPSRLTLPKYFGYLDLHNNSLKGARPLPLAGAYLLDLSMNQFNGSIPSHIGAYLENARFLSLSRNNLSGAIPDSICTPYLQVLDLSKNTLSSVIPPHLTRNSSSLSALDLAENHLEGKIPAEWGNITKIHTLKLNGPIPRSLTNLLAMVNASQSNPDYLEEYTSIGATYTNQIKISWKGWDVEFVKVLFILKCIDLSNNNLTGSIPPEMGSLQGLIALNLSRNHLSGRIPKTLGRMDQLESLDLSLNRLNGNIPLELQLLSYLQFLNLSYPTGGSF
ncbi:receptor-like protein 19 [Cryptomeria japonica]|uniref:receptor-like protein 19 n=1 Tax=Cryptomeria japonica TaxID=3369 RepID=UPI0027DA6937|nr:receptor-like protein 19 [Cryptomeria japonica]